MTEEWNEIYLLSMGCVSLEVNGNTRLFSVHIHYISNDQHLSCTIYSVVKGSNHIWSILYKKYFCFSTSSPLLTLAPFFPLGFRTCIVIGRGILINFLNSVIVVQLIIVWWTVSWFMCSLAMFQNFSCHLCFIKFQHYIYFFLFIAHGASSFSSICLLVCLPPPPPSLLLHFLIWK